MYDKLVYEVYYPDGTIKQLTTNIIAMNMILQIYSGNHHYQVLTEITDNKRGGGGIRKVDRFIRSGNNKLQ